MGSAPIPLAAVQRRILLVAADEDKTTVAENAADDRGAKAVKVPSRLQSGGAVAPDVGAVCPKLGT
jgi:hypothetical protein